MRRRILEEQCAIPESEGEPYNIHSKAKLAQSFSGHQWKCSAVRGDSQSVKWIVVVSLKIILQASR